jgi:hypothetical protein
MTAYQAQMRQTSADLQELLDPRDEQEQRTVAWLLSWDLDTLRALTAMIARRQSGR